jgi:hypothetical protein
MPPESALATGAPSHGRRQRSQERYATRRSQPLCTPRRCRAPHATRQGQDASDQGAARPHDSFSIISNSNSSILPVLEIRLYPRAHACVRHAVAVGLCLWSDPERSDRCLAIRHAAARPTTAADRKAAAPDPPALSRSSSSTRPGAHVSFTYVRMHMHMRHVPHVHWDHVHARILRLHAFLCPFMPALSSPYRCRPRRTPHPGVFSIDVRAICPLCLFYSLSSSSAHLTLSPPPFAICLLISGRRRDGGNLITLKHKKPAEQGGG